MATFYLKQVLQTLLSKINNVEHIANKVKVVNARGISTARNDGEEP